MTALTLIFAFTPTVSKADSHRCLSLVVYHESRGQIKQDQIGVAHVVLNRVKSRQFPNDICSVVYQRGQFSWVNDRHDNTPHEKKSWRTARQVASGVLEGRYGDPTGGALYFYRYDIRTPRWARNKTKHRIGNHIYVR